MNEDIRPFPIQAEPGYLGNQEIGRRSAIPWWLAEVAYEHYVKMFGHIQSLERLAERGGFGREELLMLLRRENL